MADMMRNYRTAGYSPRTCATNANEGTRPQATNCTKLKKKLQTVDFAIVETTLYLNAYPNCRTALDYYHKLLAERESLIGVINEKCGPMSARDNKSRTDWTWIDGPWPWEADANS